MGGYAKCAPTVYLVRWGDVWKAGYSNKQRWRQFQLRGAELLGLWEFPDTAAALAAERAANEFLSALGEYAFDSAADAVSYLGAGGGGYLECLRLPDAPSMPEALLTHMRNLLRAQCTDGRNGQTKN